MKNSFIFIVLIFSTLSCLMASQGIQIVNLEQECVYSVCIPCVRAAVDAKYYIDDRYAMWLHVNQHVYGDLYPTLSADERRHLLEKCENKTCGRRIDPTYTLQVLHAYRRSCDVFNIQEIPQTSLMVDGEVWEFDSKKE